MKRRILAVGGTTALLVGLAAGPALAQPEVVWHEHGHVLLLGAEVEHTEEGPPTVHGFERCVDLAGGRELKLSQHHDRVHMGNANFRGLARAGHIVQPAGYIADVVLDGEVIQEVHYPEDCEAWEQAPLPFPPN